MPTTKPSFLRDFSWYFMGSIIPILIGFIKTPIFTRHFDKEAFGHLGLVTITFSYIGMLLFSWIASCIWRYYHRHAEENTLKKLYSNLIALLAFASIAVLLLSSIWYTNASGKLVKELILFSAIQLIFNQLFLCYMVVVRLQGRAAFYTLFHSVKALISLILALVLVFVYHQGISALILSLAIVELLAVIGLILVNPSGLGFNRKLINSTQLKELLWYGGAGLVINLGILIITSSDRYIIAWLTSIENVGIYDQVYKLGQLSIWALVTIFFNTINPFLLHRLQHNFEEAPALIRNYLLPFFIVGLPLITYLSLFSEDLAWLLLGVEFREGYIIMPFVFVASYLHGISNFYELRLKFSNQLKRLTIIILVAVILNVVLTVILVSNFGYKLAALTTVLVYGFLLVNFHYHDRSLVKFSREQWFLILRILGLLAVQAALYLGFINFIDVTLLMKIGFALFLVLSYFLIFRKHLLTLTIPTHD